MARKTEAHVAALEDPAIVTEHVEAYRQKLDSDIITLAELGGGAIRFAEAVFADASIDSIYAQHNVRESEGRGPHFDIYDESIDEGYPWLGVYNLAGTCAVRAAVMPDELSEQYAKLYPKPDEAAYDARRHFGSLVLDSASTTVYHATLNEGTGLVLPQKKAGPNIIHEVAPENPSKPGSFIKMVVPKTTRTTVKSLREQNFKPLDELLTHGFGVPTEPIEPGLPDMSQLPPTPTPAPSRRRRRPERRSGSGSGDGLGVRYD